MMAGIENSLLLAGGFGGVGGLGCHPDRRACAQSPCVEVDVVHQHYSGDTPNVLLQSDKAQVSLHPLGVPLAFHL